MIRTIVKPEKARISLDIPKEFVGKQVEVIAFTVEEANHEIEVSNEIATHFASEKILAKDWLTTEEDEAWQDL